MKKNTKKKTPIVNVVTYARVSTPEQAERELSLPAQADAMEKYANTHGQKILNRYVEPGASGRDSDRKQFRRMLEDVLAPSANVDAVLVYQTSRFMRNAGEARIMKDTLKKKGIRVIAVCQETTDDPMGHLIEGVFELIDEYESQVNGMRTTAAMRENAKQGYFNGAKAPFGFRVNKVEVREGQNRGKLLPEPSEKETHNEVFRLYIDGGGAKTVSRELNKLGLRMRGRPWKKEMVLNVIQEEAAVGSYYWGKRDSRTGQWNDREDWVKIPVEAILDKAVFDLATRIREQREPERSPGRTSSSPLLLAGLVKCEACGSAFTLETSGKRSFNGEYNYRYYNCRKAIRSGKEVCGGRPVPVRVLDRIVLDDLAEKLFSFERCSMLVQELLVDSGDARKEAQERRRVLQRQITAVDASIQRWQESFESGELPKSLGIDRLRELTAKRDELIASLGSAATREPPPQKLGSDETIRRFQSVIKDVFLSADTLATKNYLRCLVEEIRVGKDQVTVVPRAEGAVSLMGFENRGGLPPVNPAIEVLTTVPGWLRLQDSNLRPGD